MSKRDHIRIPPFCLAQDLKRLNKMYFHCDEIINFYPNYLIFVEEIYDPVELRIHAHALNMQIFCLTENSTRISNEFQEKYPVLPYATFRRIRNTIAHEYENVNKEETDAIIKYISKIQAIVFDLLELYHFEDPRAEEAARKEAGM